MNLVWTYYTLDMDSEQKISFLGAVTDIGNGLLKKERKVKTTVRKNKDGKEVEKKSSVAPPPGWKTDEQNYANIQGMLGMLGQVKGAVSQQKEVKKESG